MGMCPDCETAMIVLDLDGVEIDYCHKCGGCWLDDGELELIACRATDSPEEIGDLIRRGRDGGWTGQRCPMCRCRMRESVAGQGRPIRLYRCPRGHGLWVASAEMRTLISECATTHGVVARFLADLFGAEAR